MIVNFHKKSATGMENLNKKLSSRPTSTLNLSNIMSRLRSIFVLWLFNIGAIFYPKIFQTIWSHNRKGKISKVAITDWREISSDPHIFVGFSMGHIPQVLAQAACWQTPIPSAQHQFPAPVVVLGFGGRFLSLAPSIVWNKIIKH